MWVCNTFCRDDEQFSTFESRRGWWNLVKFWYRLMSPQGQSANTARQTRGFPTRGNESWLLFQHKRGHAKLFGLKPLRASFRSDGMTTLFLCSIYISCAVVPRYARAWYRLLCCVSKTLSRLMLNGVHKLAHVTSQRDSKISGRHRPTESPSVCFHRWKISESFYLQVFDAHDQQ